MIQAQQEITQLGAYLEQAVSEGFDFMKVKEQAAQAQKQTQMRRKEYWQEWVRAGKKKSGRLFRWIKHQETLHSMRQLNHGTVNPQYGCG